MSFSWIGFPFWAFSPLWICHCPDFPPWLFIYSVAFSFKSKLAIYTVHKRNEWNPGVIYTPFFLFPFAENLIFQLFLIARVRLLFVCHSMKVPLPTCTYRGSCKFMLESSWEEVHLLLHNHLGRGLVYWRYGILTRIFIEYLIISQGRFHPTNWMCMLITHTWV